MSKRYLVFCGLASAFVLALFIYSIVNEPPQTHGPNIIQPIPVHVDLPKRADTGPKIGTRVFERWKGDVNKGLLIRCRNLEDANVSQAEIFLDSRSDLLVSLGTTEKDGTLRAPKLEIGNTLIVRHPAYVTKLLPIDRSISQELTIRLDRGGHIEGTVEYGDGSSFDGIASVIAVPNGNDLDALSVRRAVRGHPGFHLVHTRINGNGRFELTGVDPERNYTLMAGGQGIAGLNRPVVGGRDGTAVVQVASIYAAVVQLTDSVNNRLLTNTKVHSESGYLTHNFPDSGVPMLEATSPEVILAGANPWPIERNGVYSTGPFNLEHWYVSKSKGVASGQRRFAWWFVQGGGAPKIGPFSISVSVPGYEPARVDIWAERVSDQVTVQKVPLVPRTQRFGSVRIEFSNGFGVNTRKSHQTEPYGYLKLFHRDWEEMFRFAIWYPEQGPSLIEGIPSGQYFVFFDSSLTRFRLPPPNRAPYEIVVRESESQVIRFTLPPSSSLSITKQDGQPIDRKFYATHELESIEVRLGVAGPEEQKQEFKQYCPRPPVRVIGIPAGRYSIEVIGIQHGNDTPLMLCDRHVVEFREGEARMLSVRHIGK